MHIPEGGILPSRFRISLMRLNNQLFVEAHEFLSFLAPIGYGLVARNRRIISTFVAKKDPGDPTKCGLDGTCE